MKYKDGTEPAGKMSYMLRVLLTQDEAEELKKAAAEDDRSTSNYVRALIRRALKEKK